MNFFEAQERAKRHTFVFIIFFIIAIVSLIVLTNLTLVIAFTAMETETLEIAFHTFMNNSTPKTWLISSGVVLLIVGSGSFYMIYELSKGGSYVASALGGIKVSPHTNNFEEKQLLNVVTEMAIASGISVPPVYILRYKSINAFAAGHSTDDVVIGVTQGLLDLLNREELQGVIAHEFSHIFNGDMKLNMKLTGALHGIVLVGLIGEMILRATLRGSSRSSLTLVSSSGSSKKSSGGNLTLIVVTVAIIFYIIGFLGKLIGGFFKATISRKREYLADATAVQYTRYPQGIAGALKKIGSVNQGSFIGSSEASTYSHLYFANGISGFVSDMFATHPPLEERILAIDPTWNGKFPSLTAYKKERVEEKNVKEKMRENKKQMAAVLSATTLEAKMASIGKPQDIHIQYAKTVTSNLSDALKDKIDDTLGAQALILALVSEDDEVLKQRQMHILPQHILLEFEQSLKLLKELKREHYLELVQLSMPALKSSSLAQYKAFKSYLLHFIEVDKKVTLFEWSLQHIVLRPLDRSFSIKPQIKMIHTDVGDLKEEIEILLSMLVQAQYKDETQAKMAFDRVKKEKIVSLFEYIPKKEIRFSRFTQSIAALETAKPPVKKRIIEVSLTMMMADEKLSLTEHEMIHAIAEVLLIPLPPLQAN